MIATEKALEPGKTIIREQDAANAVYTLRTGYASVSRLTSDGRRQILAFQFPGDFFGLTSESAYQYSVATLTNALVCRFDRRVLEDFIAAHPQIDRTLRFLQTKQLDSAYELLFALGRKNAIQKVASFILYVSDRHRKLGMVGNPIRLVMPRADVADFLGLTTETVSRTFTDLRDMGLIETPQDANTVHILNHVKLRSIGAAIERPPTSTVQY